MQTPIDVSLHALNQKTFLTLLAVGVVPLLLILIATIFLSEGRPGRGVTLSVVLVCALLTGVGIWQLAAVRLRVDADSLTVGGGFYRVSVPLDRLADGEAHAERAAHYSIGMRTNGIGMPGLSLGWFGFPGDGKAFVAITDPDRVVRIPTKEGYTILLSTEDPDALVERLRQPGLLRQGRP